MLVSLTLLKKVIWDKKYFLKSLRPYKNKTKKGSVKFHINSFQFQFIYYVRN